MIDCPECQTAFSGKKCPTCGHLPKSTAPVNQAEYQHRMGEEAKFSQQVRDWLDHHQITKPEMTTSERMKACAAYRGKIKTTLRTADSSPKAWAHSLKSDYLDGVHLLAVQIANASDALGEVWKDGQCMPRMAA